MRASSLGLESMGMGSIAARGDKGVQQAGIGFLTAQVAGGHQRLPQAASHDNSYSQLSCEGTEGFEPFGVAGLISESELQPPLEEDMCWNDDREAAAEKLGISRKDYKIKIAAAKTIGGFRVRDKGSVGLERCSVYGAVILMPQVARSAGWPRYLTALVVESYLFLFANFIVQGGLLFMIAKEEFVMEVFAGQMYLCDFGAFIRDCPGHDWCRGPGGSEITAPRLYDYAQWKTRTFARDSFAALFPDKVREMQDSVDPGEYGIESYSCRWLCCFIFMMSVNSELFLNFRMIRLLWAVPNTCEPWVELQDFDPALEARTWLDSVEVKVAGMSPPWKVLMVIIVFVPKMVLWNLTAQAGITFLMETSTIEDIIINSVALTFVLNIDEMFYELMSEAVKVMLKCHIEMKFFDEESEEDIKEQDLMTEHSESQELRYWNICDSFSLFPIKLVTVALLTLVYVFQYYDQRCNFVSSDNIMSGHFVSKTMFLPKSIVFSPLSAYFPYFFKIPSVDEPFWTMPHADK